MVVVAVDGHHRQGKLFELDVVEYRMEGQNQAPGEDRVELASYIGDGKVRRSIAICLYALTDCLCTREQQSLTVSRYSVRLKPIFYFPRTLLLFSHRRNIESVVTGRVVLLLFSYRTYQNFLFPDRKAWPELAAHRVDRATQPAHTEASVNGTGTRYERTGSRSLFDN